MYIPATYYVVMDLTVCMWAHKHRHVLSLHMLACILSRVTPSLKWFDSWHWFILFIEPQFNLTLHPCHSHKLIHFKMCLTWKQLLIPSPEYADLKTGLNESLCSGCWVKLRHSVEMRWGKTEISSFHFSRLCLSTHLLPHSSMRIGLIICGFNETGYCHSHIWA